jgi:DDE domain
VRAENGRRESFVKIGGTEGPARSLLGTSLSGRIPSENQGRNPSRPKPLSQRTRRWHLDEMVVPIARKRMYLSRAVDHEGEILDISAHYHSLIAVPAAISKVPTKAHLPAV